MTPLAWRRVREAVKIVAWVLMCVAIWRRW